jgi:hypothetical protein
LAVVADFDPYRATSTPISKVPNSHMPVDKANGKRWALDGLAVRSVTFVGQPIAGRWVIIDRECKPAG